MAKKLNRKRRASVTDIGPLDGSENDPQMKLLRSQLTKMQLEQELRDGAIRQDERRRLFAAGATARKSTCEPDNKTNDFLSSEDYRVKWGLPPDRLRKAKRDGRLTGQKRGGRWFYSKAEVTTLWPDVFTPD